MTATIDAANSGLLDFLSALPSALYEGLRAFLFEYLGAPGAPVPFGGRSGEMDELDRWLADPAASRALVIAEAGRGKSALLARWAANVSMTGTARVKLIPVDLLGPLLKIAWEALDSWSEYIQSPDEREALLPAIERAARRDENLGRGKFGDQMVDAVSLETLAYVWAARAGVSGGRDSNWGEYQSFLTTPIADCITLRRLGGERALCSIAAALVEINGWFR